jgi:hypothetical protein
MLSGLYYSRASKRVRGHSQFWVRCGLDDPQLSTSREDQMMRSLDDPSI